MREYGQLDRTQMTVLPYLVDRLHDPVDARIATDSLVLRVDEDNLEVLVRRVLVDPVRVENAEVGSAATDTLLSGRLEGALVLELVHTLVGGLACSGEYRQSRCSLRSCTPCFPTQPDEWTHTVGGALGNGALAAATADTHAVDDIALLGLVTEAAGLVGTGGARGAVDDVQLTKLY